MLGFDRYCMPEVASDAEKAVSRPWFARGTARTPAAILLLLSSLLAVFPAPAHCGVTITQASGMVEVRRSGQPWGSITKNYILEPGMEIRTGRGARCLLLFEDGSKVEVGPSGSFTLEEAVPQQSSMRLGIGFMKAWVNRALSRRFVVRTPTAVCSVRGTEFGVEVRDNGATSVDLFKGLLAVADQSGNEVLLKDGQSIGVDGRGLGPVSGGESKKEGEGDKLRAALKREVGLDMTREEVQAAAALEQKSAIYKEGKALIDVNGNRVRLEDYIIRQTPSQFKLVVLNERTDRFDYFFYQGTFNKPMPEDISAALRQIQGRPDAPPEFFLTAYKTGRSNTTDSVTEVAAGGHLVDVNNNGVAGDAVASAFDPVTDGVVALSIPNPGGAGNQPYFQTLFDGYTLAFNGVTHHSWSLNAGNQPLGGYVPTLGAGGYPVYSAANGTGAQNTTTHLSYFHLTNLVVPPNCVSSENCTHSPEPGKLHDIIYLEDATGSVFEKFDNYIISDEGKVANTSDFAGLSKGSDFKKHLLGWNYQQIITASEFKGRKIDLVFEPKILIQSGLIR